MRFMWHYDQIRIRIHASTPDTNVQNIQTEKDAKHNHTIYNESEICNSTFG